MGFSTFTKQAISMTDNFPVNRFLLIISLFSVCACANTVIPQKEIDFVYELTVDSVFDHLFDKIYENLDARK